MHVAPHADADPSGCGPGCAPADPSPLDAGDLAAAFKALGDETRLQILRLVVDSGELCACHVEGHFDLSQPTISHHLKVLRRAGLIEGERRGTWIHYRACGDRLAQLAALLEV